MEIVIITGLSGAGKSSALRIFEDMGYYCMDNLPPSLITNFVDLTETSSKTISQLAVVVDLRGGVFFQDLTSTVQVLRQNGHDVTVVYLDARDDVLIRRYKELRRPHPLAIHGDLVSGIKKERQVLSAIKEMTIWLSIQRFDESATKNHHRKSFSGQGA